MPAPRSEGSKVYNVALGQVIRVLRESKKITQKDFAEVCGLTTSTLSRIEAGVSMPGFQASQVIAQELGYTTDQLKDLVERVMMCARDGSAAMFQPDPKEGEGPWWSEPVNVIGLVALGALIASAVAIVLANEKQKQEKLKQRKRAGC